MDLSTHPPSSLAGNMNHLPNRQAVEHMITEILPLLLTAMPESQRADFKLHIVGANVVPTYLQELMDAHADTVLFHGYLSDEEVRSVSQLRSARARQLTLTVYPCPAAAYSVLAGARGGRAAAEWGGGQGQGQPVHEVRHARGDHAAGGGGHARH